MTPTAARSMGIKGLIAGILATGCGGVGVQDKRDAGGRSNDAAADGAVGLGGGPNGGESGARGGVGGGSSGMGGVAGVGGASGLGGSHPTATGGAAATGGATASAGRGGAAGKSATGGGGTAGSDGRVCGAAGVAGSGAVPEVGTNVQDQTGFDDGTLTPYHVCTTEGPNYGQASVLDGRSCAKFFWTQVGYDGTRLKRGAEACSDLQFTKDGWYGFQFYLPDPGFPKDKTDGIAQIFANGGCSSWTAMLQVINNDLWVVHRGDCASPPEFTNLVAANIPRNSWNSIIIHFTASHLKAGGIEIWFNAATCGPGVPTYAKTAINFGFGTWTGDELTAGASNDIGLKFGMYNFDDGNYTPGETRTIYYDNVIQLVGNPTDASALVNPNR